MSKNSIGYRLTSLFVAALACLFFFDMMVTTTFAQASTQEWLSWRGPNGNGVVEDQSPPVEFSEDKNAIWKVKVPGRGHASPLVVGSQIVLATSDKEAGTQSVVSFDRETGEQKWITQVNDGNLPSRIFPTNTHASSTVVSDGELLFAVFNNNERAQVAALDLEGTIVWEKTAGVFIPKKYQFGFGASPMIYNDTVIVTTECEKEGSIAAFNTKTGEEVWRAPREDATSYSTPVVANIAGSEQLILSGGEKTVSYNPSTGEKNWEVDGPWQVTCGTAVWMDDMVFVSGGYPAGATMAIKADGSGEVVWENRVKHYEQSMLLHDGHLYGLSDNGVAYCHDAKTGEEKWKIRLENKISASPTLAGGHIYIPVERGTVYVFKANPNEYEEVAKNKLGNTIYATPAFVDNKIIFRYADGEQASKQEWLICIGKE